MNTTKIYAIWMSILIICMPIASAAAVSSITNTKVYGTTDNIEGYARTSNDPLKVEAVVSIEGDGTIAPGQLKIDDTSFTSCSPTSGSSFKCTLDYPYIGYNEPRSEAFSLLLYNDAGTLVKSESLNLVVDGLAPIINDISITRDAGKVVVNYDVKDVACTSAGCDNKCSGVGKINFANLREIDLSAKSGCRQQGSESFDIESGTSQINIEVYDRMGQVSYYTTDFFTVDKTGPVVASSALLTVGGSEIEYVGKNPVSNVVASVEITEDNLADVSGDLSALSPGKYSNLKASIIDLGSGRYVARWAGISILPDSGNGKIQVRAVDGSGNEVVRDVSYSLKIDSTKPEVVAIEAVSGDSSSCLESACYVKENGNTIMFKIRETESGFNKVESVGGTVKHSVIANMNELNSAYSAIRADRCEKGDSGFWNCYWDDVTVTKAHASEVNIYPVQGSQDDVGNQFSGMTQKAFIVDTAVPELVDDVITGSGNGLRYVLQGRGFNAEFTVRENSPVRAVGYFENVVGATSEFPINCGSEAEGLYLCKWSNIGTVVPGPLRGQEFKIDVFDYAGNKLELVRTVDIVRDAAASQDYWTVKEVTATPSAVAVDTLHRAIKLGFLVDLATVAPQIKIVNARITECSGQGMNLDQPIIIEDNLYIGGSLRAGGISGQEIVANCNVSIQSVVGRTSLTQPQQLSVALKMPIVDPSMGTIHGRVSDKIAQAQKRANIGLGGAFKVIDKVYNILNRLCGVSKSVNAVSHLFNGFGLSMAPALDGAGPVGAPAREAVKGTMAGLQEAADKISGMLGFSCKLLACDPNGFGPFYKEQAGMKTTTSVTGRRTTTEIADSNSLNLGPAGAIDADMWPNDPRDSLILSIIAPCIPGIIYNLKKMRQVQCMYLDCLQNQVPNGAPVQYCDSQYAYQQCRFVYGQVFNAIPFAHALKRLGTFFQDMLHDPLSLVFTAGTMICGKTPNLGSQVGITLSQNALCKVAYSAVKVKDIKESVEQIKNMDNLLSDFDAQEDVCDKVDLG